MKGVGWVLGKTKTIVAYAEAKLARVALKLEHIALSGLGKSVQGGENSHCRVPIDAAEIGARVWSPDDLLG